MWKSAYVGVYQLCEIIVLIIIFIETVPEYNEILLGKKVT